MKHKELMKTESILRELEKERFSQHKKWGEQNHTPMEWLPILMEEVGEVSKEALDHHFKNPNAVGKPASKKEQERRLIMYRKELVQVAAVAVQMIECFDRNNNLKTTNHAN